MTRMYELLVHMTHTLYPVYAEYVYMCICVCICVYIYVYANVHIHNDPDV